MKIKKRDGVLVAFNAEKIRIAVRKANAEVEEDYALIGLELEELISDVSKAVSNGTVENVEDVQNFVLDWMENWNYHTLYDVYSAYRNKQAEVREMNHPIDKPIDALLSAKSQVHENANKDERLLSTQRDLIAGEVSKDKVRRTMIPRHVMKAHDDGIIHIHDMDYLAQKMYNCCLVNLEDMLQNGTMINNKLIETPKSFRTAATITTQIVAGVASNQYGGQTISLAHISPFIDVSRKKIMEETRQEWLENNFTIVDDNIEKAVEKRLKREIADGVQTIQYQLETLSTTNGQSPFVSINMDLNEAPEGQPRKDLAMLIEEVLKQRIKGVKNETGRYAAPAFPKLLYVLDEHNINNDSEFYWLTKLAAECSSKRLVPDYISAKKMRELKEGNVYPCMGCRSYLTVWKDEEDEYKFYGRFNQGVTTLNLVDVALSSNKDEDKFWSLLEERLELVKEVQLIRYNHLKGTTSDVAPILWQHGAIARLKPGETIDKYLNGGYSTSSVGVAGLYECVQFVKDISHTSIEGREFAKEVLQFINDKANEWKAKYDIDFSVYGTPLESTTYRFAKALKRRFGEVEGITDKDYITNSYHINVKEPIDAFSKLSKESVFQDLTPGGAISYVELPDMSKNLEAVMQILKHMYNNTMYAEINVAADMCLECGHEGEMPFDEHKNWYCPNCGNKKRKRLQITRRVCGYIGSNPTNKGRTQDIQERVKHLGDY